LITFIKKSYEGQNSEPLRSSSRHYEYHFIETVDMGNWPQKPKSKNHLNNLMH